MEGVGPFHIDHPYVLDRLAFDLADPEAPPLPASFAYKRAPDLDLLPDINDARRGVAVWWPTFDDCEEPHFPSPPDIVVTERLTGDPDDPTDDRYETVNSPFPGHPYFIEAHFDEVPPQERYRVHVGERTRIEVWRTTDPFVYRSDVVTFVPGESP